MQTSSPHRLRIITVLVVLALAGASGAPAAAQDVVTIRVFWSTWGPIYDELMTRIGERYEAEHPGVKIEWSFNTGWQDKLVTLVATGLSPDVTYTNWVGIADLARSGTLLPLDTFVEKEGWTRDQFVPAMWDAVQHNGRMYAVPGGGDYIALFYNKNVFSESGLDPERPPHTVAELEAFSDRIYRVDAQGAYTRVGYTPGNYLHWAYIFGGEFYNEDRTQVTMDHPGNVAALEWLEALANKWDMNKINAFWQGKPGSAAANNPFVTGQSAFMINGFWAYEPIDLYGADMEYGVAPIPTLEGTEAEMSRYLIQGWYVAIPYGAKNPEAAWEFIRWAFVERAAEMGAYTLNGPTPIASFREFNELLAAQIGPGNRLIPYLDVFNQIAYHGSKYFPGTPITMEYYNRVNEAQSLVLGGREAPRQVLERFTRSLQAQLDAALGR